MKDIMTHKEHTINYIILIIVIGIMFIVTNLNIINNSSKKTVINITNNSIIKSNYNYKYNTFNIMYTKNCDTLALDDIHAYELDSLINSLNK